ncbi:MAG: alpha/beta hydrolase [Anaerolineaceae bacterium]|nr:alpha/beta hydrolase [Anaerolineaceae bacterium]
MSAILLDQKIIHYEVLGRGRPLLFLHGWVGSWRYWIPAMQATSSTFRAYAVDMWGFGDSAKEMQKYDIEQQVVLVHDFINQLGIGKIALIGHGLGALVGLVFTIQNPEMVDRLLLVSCPGIDGAVNDRLRSTSQTDLADWLLERIPLTENVRADASKTDSHAVQISLNSLKALNLPELFIRLDKSCVFVHGENDPVVENPDFDIQSELSHAVTFEQSGHFPMLDESSKFNRLVADFLALPSGESPQKLELKEEWRRRVR